MHSSGRSCTGLQPAQMAALLHRRSWMPSGQAARQSALLTVQSLQRQIMQAQAAVCLWKHGQSGKQQLLLAPRHPLVQQAPQQSAERALRTGLHQQLLS